MYTTGEVTLRAMQIPNELLTDVIKQIQAYKDYVAAFKGVEVPTIQLELVESTKGTIRTPSTTRLPNPKSAKKKKKGKKSVGELSMPKKSLKIKIKRKATTTAHLPLIDDAERDDSIEATQLSLAVAKTAKEFEAQQNVALVDNKILEEDVVTPLKIKLWRNDNVGVRRHGTRSTSHRKTTSK
ncbi:hypothetical protein Tco_0603749 [Tanacetum coccineum]